MLRGVALLTSWPVDTRHIQLINDIYCRVLFSSIGRLVSAGLISAGLLIPRRLVVTMTSFPTRMILLSFVSVYYR